MNTEFSLLSRQLQLYRYPAKHQHKSLQAWDSADELLIEHLEHKCQPLSTQRIAILNDEWGTLGCWFAPLTPLWMTDSFLAQQALAANLLRNQQQLALEDGAGPTPQSALTPLKTPLDLVLIKIPRTLALLEQELLSLRQVVTPQTRVIAAGKLPLFTRNLFALFERLLGPTTTSLAKKKSRLLFCAPSEARLRQPVASPYPTCWSLPCSNGQELLIANHANVFSRQTLDIGARFMLQHMQVKQGGKIIDLGCGNGVLGLQALIMSPQARVTFVDESFMALASAQDNVHYNLPTRLSDCEFIASNCLEQLLDTPTNHGSYDQVLCNPPFHQQSTITDHIAWQMIHDAHAILKRQGELWVVCNRHLPYHAQLKKCFGGATVVATNAKFVIFKAIKH